MEESSDTTHKGNLFHLYYSVFITEFYIFSASHSAPKSCNILKDKTENKLWKKMDTSNSVSKRNPQETFNIHLCQSHHLSLWVFCFNH